MNKSSDEIINILYIRKDYYEDWIEKLSDKKQKDRL